MAIPLKYNPQIDVDPEGWLALDEQERIDLVRYYHRRKRIRLPQEKLHAVIHVVVENNAAAGDEDSTRSALSRLMSEGLDRHEAIHAIGSVLAEQIFHVLKGTDPKADRKAEYRQKLNRLTAQSWLRNQPD